MGFSESNVYGISELELRFSDKYSILSKPNNGEEIHIDSETIPHYFLIVPQIHIEVIERCNFNCSYRGAERQPPDYCQIMFSAACCARWLWAAFILPKFHLTPKRI